MGMLAIGVALACGLAVLLVVAVLPSALIWVLAQSIAHRVAGDEDNLWAIIPAFVALMLLVIAIDAGCTFLLGIRGAPGSDIRVQISAGIAFYCLVASGLVIVGGVGKLLFSTVEALFDGLNNAIRGDS
jgi:hypothetical protein